MNRAIFPLLALVLCLAGCGFFGGSGEAPQIDPYRSATAARINEVLYTRKSPEKILARLEEDFGIQPGRLFGEFKSTTGIDDWFGEPRADGSIRYTSLSCGLSPVVNDAGQMTSFYRGRKFFDGKMYPAIPLSPGLEAWE